MPNAPLVSVVLPVYNAEPYLRAAVNSLLIQDYTSHEIVAIDDGSTDRSLAILETLQRRDPRLRVVSRENRGIVATLNEGLALARGTLIARMDADDISYPHRISCQVEAFERDPSLAICGSGYDIILTDRRGLRFSADATADADLSAYGAFHTVLAHPTVIFNRAVIGEAELKYDPKYELAEDFEIFSRIGRQHAISRINAQLLAYRRHPASLSTRKSKAVQAATLGIIAENLAHFGVPADLERISDLVHTSGTEANVVELNRAFAAIQSRIALLEDHVRGALDQSFRHFVRVTVNALCARGDCRAARAFCDEGGYWEVLRRRERLFLRTSRMHPPGSWKRFEAASRRLDVLRSVPLSSLVPRYREIVDA